MIDFPNSPTTGQIFQNWKWDGTKWVAIGTGASITVSDTAPASPTAGALWWDSVGGQLYLYYTDPNSSEWVPATNQGSPPRSPPPSNPNKLINPYMEIDQANEGAAPTLNNTVQSVRIIDGFISNFTSSTSTATASTGRYSTVPPPGYTYNLVHQTGSPAAAVAAGDYMQVYQAIEADELCDIGFGTAQAQPLTLSFWAWNTLPGTYYVSVRNPAGTRSYLASYTISAASTWQFFTITIPGDTTGTWVTSGNAAGMFIQWTLGCGTTYQGSAANTWLSGAFMGVTGMPNTFMTTLNATLRLGPCKLEVGSTATPMLRQSFQQELARCQRYYEKSYDPGTALGTVTIGNAVYLISMQSTAAATAGLWYSFKVTKRANPTFTMYSPNTGAAGKIRDANNNTDLTATLVTTGLNSAAGSCTTVSNCYITGHFVADARL